MSPKRGLRVKGLRMVVVYLVGMCFAQNMIVEQLFFVLRGFWNLRKPCQHLLLLLLKILMILV